MEDSLPRFAPVQKAIERENGDHDFLRKYLVVSENKAGIHLDFYASPFATYFDDLLTILSEAEIASRLKTLHFRAPDEGSNGTRHWSFGRLVNSDAVFPNLTQLWIERYDGFSHNHPIVCDKPMTYSENGLLGRWLAKAPNLKYLSAPSAPDRNFFEREQTALEVLHIQAGYDPQGFILNFATAQCFPNLRHLEYLDYDETYLDDYRQRCTPFEHFVQLFQSSACDSLRSFVWYNPIFSLDSLSQLKALRPQLSLKVVRIASEWVKGGLS